MMSNEVEFFLYCKTDCSACDVFKAQLDAYGVSYHLIDIGDDPELKHLYGARIPVLVSGNTEICEGTYNNSAVDAYLLAMDRGL
jgi:hypothetical protein